MKKAIPYICIIIVLLTLLLLGPNPNSFSTFVDSINNVNEYGVRYSFLIESSFGIMGKSKINGTLVYLFKNGSKVFDFFYSPPEYGMRIFVLPNSTLSCTFSNSAMYCINGTPTSNEYDLTRLWDTNLHMEILKEALKERKVEVKFISEENILNETCKLYNFEIDKKLFVKKIKLTSLSDELLENVTLRACIDKNGVILNSLLNINGISNVGIKVKMEANSLFFEIPDNEFKVPQ